MNHWLSGAIVAASLMLFTSNAGAHINLGSPAVRDTGLKKGPCGTAGSVRGTNVTTFKPGEKITVTWTETVNHPGHYRISFDEDGTDDFVDPKGFDDYNTAPSVIVDNIADKSGSMQMYSQEVTLPNVECDNCTLQLIQVMTDKEPYGDGNDNYYQCADLVLKADGTSSSASGSTTSAGPSGSSSAASGGSISAAASGSGGAGGGGDGEGGASSGGDGGGCSCIVGGGNEGGSLSALALIALAWLTKARRTRSGR